MPTAPARAAARLRARSRIRKKPRARKQIHIRIEHERQHQCGTRKRAHIGKPIVPGLPSGQRLERGLHRSVGGQEPGIGVGEHIGGCRERQDQCGFEQPPAGELAARRQPRGRDADDQHADDHEHHDRERVQDVLGQHGFGEVDEGRARAGEDAHAHRGDRNREQQSENERRHIERALRGGACRSAYPSMGSQRRSWSKPGAGCGRRPIRWLG